MSVRSFIFGLSAMIALSILIVLASRLVLPACGSVMGWFNASWTFCPQAEGQIDDPIRNEQDRRDALLTRIALLEDQVARQHCPVQVAEEPRVDGPDFAENSEDQRRFDEGDDTVLEGCWQLDQSLTFTHLDTGVETNFNRWQMCFDAQGNGTQSMTSSDGRVSCDGPVPGSIAPGGVLSIIEPGNLQCSDNTFIYRREITCQIDSDGFLFCDSVQPEVNSSDQPFRMRRE